MRRRLRAVGLGSAIGLAVLALLFVGVAVSLVAAVLLLALGAGAIIGTRR